MSADLLGTFLGGSLVATVATFFLNRWKDHRDTRNRHDSERQAAYQELLAALEETRAVTVSLLFTRAGSSLEEWLKTTGTLTQDIVRRLGAARSRVVLADDDPTTRDAVGGVWVDAVAVLYGATMALVNTKDAAKELPEQQARMKALVTKLDVFEATYAYRCRVMREVQASLLPRSMVEARAEKRFRKDMGRQLAALAKSIVESAEASKSKESR